MLLLAIAASVLGTARSDSLMINVAFESAADRPPLEWVLFDSANMPVETGKTPWTFSRNVRGKLFVVCGTRTGEQVSVRIQITGTSMSLQGSAECFRFGESKGKVVLVGVDRREVSKPGP